MKACVSGKSGNKRGRGLEAPCLVTVKASEHIFSKLDPTIKDLCILYICGEKIALFMLLITVNKRNSMFDNRKVASRDR